MAIRTVVLCCGIRVPWLHHVAFVQNPIVKFLIYYLLWSITNRRPWPRRCSEIGLHCCLLAELVSREEQWGGAPLLSIIEVLDPWLEPWGETPLLSIVRLVVSPSSWDCTQVSGSRGRRSPWSTQWYEGRSSKHSCLSARSGSWRWSLPGSWVKPWRLEPGCS